MNYIKLLFLLISTTIFAQVDLGDDLESCQGDMLTLDATTTNASSYQWYFNDDIITAATQEIFDATETGTYKVEVTVSGNVYQDEIQVTLYDLPVANYISVNECDDYIQDGIITIDLTQFNTSITDDVTNTVTYFLTESDANLNINPINSSNLFTTGETQLFVIVENTHLCASVSSIHISIYSHPESLDALTICETDNNDIETFDLNNVNTSFLFIDTIQFFETQTDAENNTNELSNNYTNTSNPQTIYAKILNNVGCEYIASLELQVYEKPIILTPTDLENCNVEYDGYVIFNLSLKNSEILNGLDSSLYQITYHSSYDLANEGNSALNESNHYTNSNETLYVRVENIATGCFAITSLQLIINQEQIIQFYPAKILACDGDNDGFETFDLTVKNSEILNGSSSTIIFYESSYDATYNTNPILNPTAFTNTSTNQTIYARAQNTDGCLSNTISFQLHFSNPVINIEGDYFLCFTENFITLNPGFNPTLYDLEWRDENNILLSTQNIYSVYDAGTYYLTVTEEATSCSTTATINVEISDEVVVNTPIDLNECIDNSTGMATFDLTSIESQLGINLSDFTINYYISPDYPYGNINPITYPQAYISDTSELFTNNIYIGLQSNFDGCVTVVNYQIYALDCNDNDSDGVPNYEEDLNNNGDLTDDDTDLDTIPNYLDNDDDGDNVDTIIETSATRNTNTFIDTDNDTIENYLDNDDDGDGVLTINEDYNNNGDPTDDDTNSNGIPDYLESSVALSVNNSFLNVFSLYPNPIKDKLTITFINDIVKKASVSIFTIQGQIVFKSKLNKTNTSLNLSSLNNGIYLIKITKNNKNYIQKIIIK